jgi:hypothetical protein
MKENGLVIHDCKCSDQCESCIVGKLSRNPFPKQATPVNQVFDVVVSDLCGPITPSSYGGGQYILTFKDVYSKYVEIKVIKYKSETAQHVINFIKKIKTQHGKTIKIFRTDRGTEYLNNT